MTRDSSLPTPVLVRQLLGRDETRQQHSRAARKGREVRVGRGAYVEREAWEALARAEKQWVRQNAYARTRARAPIFSHWSAAVLHGLPFADERSGDIHVAVGSTAGGRSAKGVRAHSVHVPDDDIVEIDGTLCTDLARTVVDVAATSPMREAVAATDHVLPVASARSADENSEEVRRGLLAAWMRAQPLRGPPCPRRHLLRRWPVRIGAGVGQQGGDV
jgi:predicted transcriptional regulator of viral defense system